MPLIGDNNVSFAIHQSCQPGTAASLAVVGVTNDAAINRLARWMAIWNI